MSTCSVKLVGNYHYITFYAGHTSQVGVWQKKIYVKGERKSRSCFNIHAFDATSLHVPIIAIKSYLHLNTTLTKITQSN